MVPDHRARQAVRQAMRRQGVPLSRHHLWTDVERGTREVLIALGRRYNPLPSPEWMQEKIDSGQVDQHSLEGALYWLVVKVWHHRGGTHSAQADLLEVETGRVARSAMAERGEGRDGLRDAVADAVGELEIRFAPATDGTVNVQSDAGVHRVDEGDSLWSIAEEEYNDGGKWRKIYRANEKLIGPDPDRLDSGQVLTIP